MLHGLTTDVETTVLIQPDTELYDEIREILNKYAAERSSAEPSGNDVPLQAPRR